MRKQLRTSATVRSTPYYLYIESAQVNVCRSPVVSKVPLAPSNAYIHRNPFNTTSTILEAAPATSSRHFSATSRILKFNELVNISGETIGHESGRKISEIRKRNSE